MEEDIRKALDTLFFSVIEEEKKDEPEQGKTDEECGIVYERSPESYDRGDDEDEINDEENYDRYLDATFSAENLQTRIRNSMEVLQNIYDYLCDNRYYDSDYDRIDSRIDDLDALLENLDSDVSYYVEYDSDERY